jgi:hypothetical protein
MLINLANPQEVQILSVIKIVLCRGLCKGLSKIKLEPDIIQMTEPGRHRGLKVCVVRSVTA